MEANAACVRPIFSEVTMSNGTLSNIMSRISSATPSSPIAVFVSDRPKMANAVFADTAVSKRVLKLNMPELIGVYDATMPLLHVREEIRAHIVDAP